MKLDPYKNKEKYENWKTKGAKIPDVSKMNHKLIIDFLFDFEQGKNVDVSNKKGARSYARLNAYRSKLATISKWFDKDFPKISKDDVHSVFNKLERGEITRLDGKPYSDLLDYLKTFKAFWSWLQKTHKTKLNDVAEDIGVKKVKPKWVYLDFEQFKKLANNSKPYYKVLALFMLDTGQRVTEFKNCKVSSFKEDFTKYTITDEISKTIGRTIKLMLSSQLIKEYIEENDLKDDDTIFNVSVSKTNQYYKRIAKRLFGKGKSLAGANYSNISLTDFRHISACYWLKRYKKESGMMYRFGWQKADKVHYYSEFLGMEDNIEEEDMTLDTTKTQLQNENDKLRQDFEIYRDNTEKELELLKKFVLGNLPSKIKIKDIPTAYNKMIYD